MHAHYLLMYANLRMMAKNRCFLNDISIHQHNTVEPQNKGHVGDNINSAVVSFVERLFSFGCYIASTILFGP